MRWTKLLALVACVGCTHRPPEQIPLVQIPKLDGPRPTVHLVVVDARIQDLFPQNRPELLMTTDLRDLVANRFEHELARNGVAVRASAPTMARVEILDYWAEFRRADFMDYRTTATVRLQVTVNSAQPRTWRLTGAAKQPHRVADPLPVAVDLLEKALDQSIQQAHELGVFRELAGIPASSSP